MRIDIAPHKCPREKHTHHVPDHHHFHILYTPTSMIVVREPTMADYRRAANDPWWWAACLSCEDGTPLLADPADLGRLSADVSTRLWEQVNAPHPTQPPPGGCGESQARNSET